MYPIERKYLVIRNAALVVAGSLSLLSLASRPAVAQSGGTSPNPSYISPPVGVNTTNPVSLFEIYAPGSSSANPGAVIQDSVTPPFASNADNLLSVRGTGSSAGMWRGRITAGGDNAEFLFGEFNGQAWLGAHNSALSAWADLFVNPEAGTTTRVFIGAHGSRTNSILTVDNGSGNVGINNTAPAATLDVNGNLKVATSIQAQSLTFPDGSIQTKAFNPANAGYTLGPNGFIGIGTTTPSNTLSVNGDADIASRLKFDASNAYGGSSAVFGISPSGGNKRFLFYDYFTNTPLMTINDATAGGGVSIGSGYIGWGGDNTAPANGLAVQGRVGIGTTTPAFPLDVTGAARVTQLLFPDGSSFSSANLPPQNGPDAILGHPSGNQVINQPAGTTFRIQSTLMAGQNTNGTAIIDAFNGDAYFGNNGAGPSYGISVDPYSQVGIGTGTPLGNLDIEASGANQYGHLIVNRTNPGGTGGELTVRNAANAAGTSAAIAFELDGSTAFGTDGSNASNAEIRAISNGPAQSQATDLILSNFNGTAEVQNLAIQGSSGNVGVGTVTPNSRLEVKGSITLTHASGGSIKFQDDTVQTTAWNGTLLGGDYAELVDVRGGKTAYQPGDVIAIDPSSPGSFSRVAQPYSRLVAGVYSTKPGAVGRRATAPRPDKEQEVPMAMIGIVPTKVTAENGAIEPGDLLVASSTAGYAMKGTDPTRMQGAVIGKALASLRSGEGLIEVLITLQ